jgi:hypothetical protein
MKGSHDLKIQFTTSFSISLVEMQREAAPKLVALGLSIKIDRAAKGSDWVIHGNKTMVPSEAELLKLRRRAAALRIE